MSQYNKMVDSKTVNVVYFIHKKEPPYGSSIHTPSATDGLGWSTTKKRNAVPAVRLGALTY